LPSLNYSSRLLNRAVLEASKANKHIIPVAFIPKTASKSEVFRYKRQGFKGFKVHSDISQAQADAFATAQLPIILHPPLSPSSSQFKALIIRIAGRFPLVLAHFGRGHTRNESMDLIKLIAPHQNIFVDTSAYVGRKQTVEQVIRNLGPDRVLFGTDRPFNSLAGTNLILSEKYGTKIPAHLVGQKRFLTDNDYRWNTPELKAIFRELKIPKPKIGERTDQMLEEALNRLLRQGVISPKDLRKIFFSTARRLFRV
jgi:predicted TIM-barrel fold metal-dependent hydrolase